MSFQWNLEASEFSPSFSTGLSAEAHEFNPFDLPAEPPAVQTEAVPVAKPAVQPVVEVSAPTESIVELQPEPALTAKAEIEPIPVQQQAQPVEPATPQEPEKSPEAAVEQQPNPPLPESSQKIYSREVVLALKELCKVLPPGIDIPEGYNIRDRNVKGGKRNGKKGRRDPKPAPDVSAELIQSEDSFSKKRREEKSEDQKQVNRLRFTLNRLSDLNFDKLTAELFAEFTFEGTLLRRLVQFIFELATAHHNYAELYVKLCSLLRKKFWDSGKKDLSKEFRTHLLTSCEECFYQKAEPLKDSETMDAEFKRRRRLMGNIKFIALLYKERFMKNTIMHECFSVLLDEKNICDESVETFCALFTEVAPEMPEKSSDSFEELRDLEGFYTRVVALIADSRLSKRTHFLIQDLVDEKPKLLSLKVKGHRSTPAKRSVPDSPSKPQVETPKKKEESSDSSREEDSPSRLSRLTAATKSRLQHIIRHYAGDRNAEDAFVSLEKLMKETETPGEEVVHQILKYTLCELSQEMHSLMCALVASHFTADAYAGFVHTVQATKDLELDCPMAAQYLETMTREVEERKVFSQEQAERLDALLRNAIAASPLSSPSKVPPTSQSREIRLFDDQPSEELIVCSTQASIHRLIRSLSVTKSVQEAVETAQAGKLPLVDVVEQGLKYTLLELSEKDLRPVCELLGALVDSGQGTAGEVTEGLERVTADLEELQVDCPKAPRYLREALTVLQELHAAEASSVLLAKLPS